jgi:hypothetical protein
MHPKTLHFQTDRATVRLRLVSTRPPLVRQDRPRPLSGPLPVERSRLHDGGGPRADVSCSADPWVRSGRGNFRPSFLSYSMAHSECPGLVLMATRHSGDPGPTVQNILLASLIDVWSVANILDGVAEQAPEPILSGPMFRNAAPPRSLSPDACPTPYRTSPWLDREAVKNPDACPRTAGT